MKSRLASGTAAVLLTVLIWGAQFPIAKATFQFVDPFHTTAIRYAIGTLLLIPIFLLLEGRNALQYYGRLGPAVFFGVVGMSLSPMLVFLGVSLSRPEHAAVIVALQPSMTALADWIVRGRRPANFTLACMAVAFLGVVAVVTKLDAMVFAKGELLGDLLVFLGALCWVAYTLSNESFKGWSALRFTTLTLIPGTIATVALTVALDFAGLLQAPTALALTSVGWHLVYLTVFGVVISMVCWNIGNQRIGALNTMLLMNFVPVVTFAVQMAQGTRFQPIELAGASLVIGALIANNFYLRRKARRFPQIMTKEPR